MRCNPAVLVAAVSGLFAAQGALASCGSAFCLVNTNWGVQGVWNESGLRGDVRFEYIDQDQPRTGTRDIGVGEIPRHHDEVRTVNRNTFVTLDYGISEDLGASVVLPWVDRTHDHIHNHHGEQIPEHWSFSDLGDMRATLRYQKPVAENPANASLSFVGLTAGLKLPTGRTTVSNSEGEAAERTLQPGTGTTDALLGGYYRQAIGAWDASWFVQVNAQLPLNTYRDFRPGRQLLLDVGARWQPHQDWSFMLQVNAHWKGRDSGAEAEPEDSGSRTVTISPGLSYAITPAVQVYGFVQLPLYQSVNGVQLVADRSYAVGVSAQF